MKERPSPDGGEGLLTVTELVKMFEDAESASYEARQLAERDRDYHDNKQLSDEEIATLNKRKQPHYIDNRIKTKVDYLVGLEKQQRIDPVAKPRTPMHEEDANAATQVLKYVADDQKYDAKRSACWRNLLIEGMAGLSVTVEQGYDGPRVVLRRIPWDRMFYDPHSSELDFSDAGYLGCVQWMDEEDARRIYPDAEDIITHTISETQAASTYDDKPKYQVWGDWKRRRIRVVQMWIKRGDDWHFAEFTKGGILKAGPSPYQDDKGGSDCEFVFQSAYVDRDNNRFGLVREMILLQDAINKRNSKALHLLNTSQIVMVDGAVADVEKTRREAARPDGVIVVNPLGGSLNDTFQFNTRADLATAHYQMLQEAKNSIDLKGPNATQMGDSAGGSGEVASGRAILASQQGGMISLGDLLDSLKHMDLRVFEKVWYRIRQFWTGEKWVKTTDDEKNLRWVAVNVDPMQLQMIAMQQPEMAQKIAGQINSLAELECDITIEDGPNGVTLQMEQFEAVSRLAEKGLIPPEELIRAWPGLRDKQRILERMSQTDPAMAQMKQIEMAQGAAKVDETRASTGLKQAQTAKAMMDAQMQPMKAAHEMDLQRAADMRASMQQDHQRQFDFTKLQADQQAAQPGF